MLTFKIFNQNIVVAGKEPVADSVKYLKARFYFSSDWSDDLHKYALFYLNGEDTPIQISIDSNECIVPSEVIHAPHFEVSVYGANDDNKVITTDKVTIKVKESGMAEGSPPLPPPVNLYEQVVTAVNKYIETKNELIRIGNEFIQTVETFGNTTKQSITDTANKAITDITNICNTSEENITNAEDLALQAIAGALSEAIKKIDNAGEANSTTTFNEDGTITKVNASVTITTKFESDGSIVETYDYVDGTKKVITTTFSGNKINVVVS